jgi:hypothetical protein
VDPWGSEYLVTCGDAATVVVSAGRDRQLGTDDDLVIVEPALYSEGEPLDPQP